LLVIGLGLGVALVSVKRQAADEKKKDSTTILDLSNQVVKATENWQEQKNVNAQLDRDLDLAKKTFEKALGDLTNNFTQVSVDLGKTEASLKASQEAIAKLEAKNAELETRNLALDKQALELTTAITNLTIQIADTQRKLVASEGDKAFLERELKRLQGEKADLERQFNDLTVLRAQVAKLKEDLVIAKRLEWARQGILANADQKGAQRLMQGLSASGKSTPRTNADLNVEVKSDGSVRVIPPLTNAPPATAAPPK
jgi:chromosome segregation ATPase